MTPAEYKRRRRRLARQLGRSAIAIVPAAGQVRRNRDVHYSFRQDSDFQYLTGFPESDAVAVLVPGHAGGEFILFCHPRDPEFERWNGLRIGVEGACESFGADIAYPLAEIDQHLPGLLKGREQVHYPIGRCAGFDQRVISWLGAASGNRRVAGRIPDTLVNSDTLLHEQRLIKSRSEIAVMRRAAKISAAAHCRLMRRCQPGMGESELAALFRYRCARRGAGVLAYPSIVGGGANGCVLHYVDNDATLRDGDLVLIDAGCEFAGYASDITRTFPVNGRFSKPQRALYELVLAAQRAAFAAARPGNDFNAPHRAAVKVLTKGLVELGVLDGRPAALIKEEAYKPFYMHGTSHWLGMDVHDVGRYKDGKRWRVLEPGMLFSIEPGLYMPLDESVPAAYRGIGIRIEDEVLITDSGAEILSADAPTNPDAIEALMAG